MTCSTIKTSNSNMLFMIKVSQTPVRDVCLGAIWAGVVWTEMTLFSWGDAAQRCADAGMQLAKKQARWASNSQHIQASLPQMLRAFATELLTEPAWPAVSSAYGSFSQADTHFGIGGKEYLWLVARASLLEYVQLLLPCRYGFQQFQHQFCTPHLHKTHA